MIKESVKEVIRESYEDIEDGGTGDVIINIAYNGEDVNLEGDYNDCITIAKIIDNNRRIFVNDKLIN